jgi:hypothetical protein
VITQFVLYDLVLRIFNKAQQQTKAYQDSSAAPTSTIQKGAGVFLQTDPLSLKLRRLELRKMTLCFSAISILRSSFRFNFIARFEVFRSFH